MNRRPQVVISDTGASFLKKGQMWMYRNNLISSLDEIPNGAPVDIVTEDGTYYGSGFLSKNSHITVRILSKDPSQEFDRTFFETRMQAAWSFRRTLQKDNLTNCRVIFGEADLLPGLTVDRYNQILVSQISTYGMEQTKDLLYEVLLETLQKDGQDVKAVYERNDTAFRKKEGLPLQKGFWHGAAEPVLVTIAENGLKIQVDIENGQKTGYFLDQKENRLRIRHMSEGMKVLDCFTHTGGFALNAAKGGAAHVTAVDISETALKEAEINAKLNHLENRVSFVKDDVFDYLSKVKQGDYDLIILDPPAFTKSRSSADHAYNGYKRLNEMAMRLQRGGRYLATCSCSRFMETARFEQMLKEAAQECGVTLKQVSVTQQNSDHPILWTMEETSYLKFYIFQIL